MERYESYKDSGVQWLGKIPSHWESVPFKSVFTLGKGLSITKENLIENGVNVISYGQIHSKQNKFSYVIPELYRFVNESYLQTNPQSLVKKEDFIFADTSEDVEGSGNFVRIDNSVNTFAGYHTIIARNSKTEFGHFLSYLLQSKLWKVQIWVQVHGIKVFSITRDILNNTKIILPPLSEQQSIVSFLDSKCSKIDEWIEKKQKEVELLGELKQRLIADAVTRGLNPHVKMKATNIPWLKEIPEHWENKRLAAMFTDDIETNKDFQYKRAFKFNYGCLVPKNEIGDPEEYRAVYVKYSIVNTGDILINGLNLNYDFISQRVACAPSDGIITSAYVVCRPRPNVNYDYYTYLFKAMDSIKLFHGMGTGIRLTLAFKELKKQMLPVPPLEEQKQIVAHITDKTSKIDKLIANITKEIDCIKEYKQRLISDVVTGQIKVC